MKQRILHNQSTLLVLAALAFAPPNVQGEQFGLFSYESTGSSIEITNYPDDAVGSVVIPAEIEGLPVTTIGPYAFEDSYFITDVTIPPSVRVLRDSAFESCLSLTSITLPASGITSIEKHAFSRCSGLTTIDLPSTLTSLGEEAFNDCNGLTSILIPAATTSLGGNIILDCRALTDIDVEAGNTEFDSIDGVLYNQALTAIVRLPQARTGAYPIPEGVTNVRASAFQNCENLHEIIIPPSVVTIGRDAFRGCQGLTSLSLPPGLTTIGSGAFGYCNGLVSLIVPPSVNLIGEAAFLGCASLTSFTLPPAITSIRDDMFGGCFSLTSITIPPGVTALGDCAFRSCSSLRNLVIPPSVHTIGSWCFRRCNALVDIALPEGVITIGQYAFEGCARLERAYLPASATALDRQLFRDCQSLTSIEVHPDNPNFSSHGGVFFDKLQGNLITYPVGKAGAYHVPASVSQLSRHSFLNCRQLTSITIPDSVTLIGDRSFSGCSALNYAVYLGDAPRFEIQVYRAMNSKFTTYYLPGKTGYSSPLWHNYPATEVADPPDSIGDWLGSHGLTPESDLASDLNGDGVTLLMAYALDLNPHEDLKTDLPPPTVLGDTLSLSFYAASPGIHYVIETSVDLSTWTTQQVTLSEPDAAHRRIASIALDTRQRYMRLVVMNPARE